MPLSKKRDRDRKKFQPNSNLNSNKDSNPNRDNVVQPDRAKIRELRDMMDNIGGLSPKNLHMIDEGMGQTELIDLGSFAQYVEDEREDWPDIDADGNLIPDF